MVLMCWLIHHFLQFLVHYFRKPISISYYGSQVITLRLSCVGGGSRIFKWGRGAKDYIMRNYKHVYSAKSITVAVQGQLEAPYTTIWVLFWINLIQNAWDAKKTLLIQIKGGGGGACCAPTWIHHWVCGSFPSNEDSTPLHIKHSMLTNIQEGPKVTTLSRCYWTYIASWARGGGGGGGGTHPILW